jgi:hypothetical protein
MTPLAGFVLAVIAGWITRDARRAAAIIILPFLAVTAMQTYGIAAGDGHSPPSTVWPLNGASIPYYVVQLLIMAAVLGVGTLLGTVRAQRTAGSDDSDLRRRTTIATVTGTVLTVCYIIGAWLEASPVRQHSSQGGPPAQGLIGMGVLIISLIVLAAMTITGRRRATRASQAGEAAGVRASYGATSSGARVGALAVGAVLMLGTAGVTAAHASHQAAASGVVHFYESGTGGSTDADILTGVIGDHGVDHIGVADHGNINKIVLTNGTFEVNTSKIGPRLRVVSSDRRACTLVVKGTAPVPVLHGTGRYAGIHGTLTVTLVNALVFPRKKSGACDENFPAVKAKLTWATGSGHVSF